MINLPCGTKLVSQEGKITPSCLLGQPIIVQDLFILPTHGANHVIILFLFFFFIDCALNTGLNLQTIIRSAYEPRGPPGWRLSQFLQHEAIRNISTPSWMGSVAGLPTALSTEVPICTSSGERHCQSKLSCPRTQHNVPGQGFNPDRWIWT